MGVRHLKGTEIETLCAFNCENVQKMFPDGPNGTKCFLYDGDEIVQQPMLFDDMTQNLVDDFKYFIHQRKNEVILSERKVNNYTNCSPLDPSSSTFHSLMFILHNSLTINSFIVQ